MKDHVFISYSTEDTIVVKPIVEKLIQRGIKIWIDKKNILPGDKLPSSISEGITNSGYFLAFISSNSLNSKWSRWEIDLALNLEIETESILIIPVLLDSSKLPNNLYAKRYADCSSQEKVADAVNNIVSQIKENPISSNQDDLRIKMILKEREEKIEKLEKLRQEQIGEYKIKSDKMIQDMVDNVLDKMHDDNVPFFLKPFFGKRKK